MKDWEKIIDKPYHKVFAKKGAKVGHGIVVIDKIPDVDIKTIKTTGYSYSVTDSKKKNWTNYGNFSSAMKDARKRMKKLG